MLYNDDIWEMFLKANGLKEDNIMKKILLIILSLSLMFQIGVLVVDAESSLGDHIYDISDGNITIEKETGDTLKVTYGLTYGSEGTVQDGISQETELTLTGESSSFKITITGVTANITFNNLIIIGHNTVKIENRSNINLTLKGDNVLENISYGAGLGLGNSTLTITEASTGKLTAKGLAGGGPAGIGCNPGGKEVTVNINGEL